MIAQSTRRPVGRGFSLDEAARIRASLVAGLEALECPRCAHPLGVTTGKEGSEDVDLIFCEFCRNAVLLHVAGSPR